MSPCEKYQQMIDDAVDGDLPADANAALNRHLSECRACREAYQRTWALVEALEALPDEDEPRRDLWPDIESRLQPRPGGLRPGRIMAIAAAAAAVVIAAVGLLQTNVPRDVVGTAGGGTAPGIQQASNDPALDEARTDYRQARTELKAVIEARRDSYSPETRAVIDRNLAIIDKAIDDIERVMAANPNQEGLDRQLRLAYSRQIDMLRWVARMPGGREGT